MQECHCDTEINEMETKKHYKRSQCSRITSPFSMRYSRVEDFTTAPCFRSRSLPVICVFRAVAALYLTSWWLYNISANMHNGKMFIYYSNICFTFVSFYFVIGFNLSSISIRQRRDELYQKDNENPELILKSTEQDPRCGKAEGKESTMSEVIFSEDEISSRAAEPLSPRDEIKFHIQEMKDKDDNEQDDEESSSLTTPETSTTRSLDTCYKIYWFFFYISSNTSCILAMGYLFGYLEDYVSYPNTITKHLVPLCLVGMDFLLSGIPVYMGHVLYPVIFSLLYYIFTICYWAAGGTDPQGRAYIYKVLNYDHISVKQALIPPLTMLLVQPLTHFAFYTISVTRRFFQEKACCKN